MLVHASTDTPTRPWRGGPEWRDPKAVIPVRTQMQRAAARTPAHPHQSQLVLGALPGAVPCARLHTRLVLAEWGLKPPAEAAELVVSELVTNAIRASEALPERQHRLPTVQLWLSAG